MGKLVSIIAESESKVTYSQLPRADTPRKEQDISIPKELSHRSPKALLENGLRRALERFRSKEEIYASLT
jgi:hypothetical protein